MMHRFMLAAAVAALLIASPEAQDTPRESWQRVDDILAALGAVPGARIADVGAGDGYFTTRMSRAVGDSGEVFAVDVSAQALERLRGRLERDGIRNVTVIEGAYDDPKLPAGRADGALIINAYHEMTQHQQMLAGIARGLKPGGRLVIVEPISESRRDAERSAQTRQHEIAARFVLEDLRQAGFRVIRFEEDFTRRPHGDTEWIIVATPAAGASAPALPSPQGAPVAATEDASNDNEDWRSPALRIERDAAMALYEQGAALFVDVRNLEMFEEGHLPGARLLMLSEIEASVASLGEVGKRVIAYCS